MKKSKALKSISVDGVRIGINCTHNSNTDHITISTGFTKSVNNSSIRIKHLKSIFTEYGVYIRITCQYNVNTNHIGIYTSFNQDSNYNGGLKTNIKCSSYLGVHIAEQILSRIYENVQRMPYGNPGYDFICGKGYKIDVKSACYCKYEKASWKFLIKYNTIPDFFLCLVFDNRIDLNPQHVWLVPGEVLNRFSGISISESTLDKWFKYEQSLDKVLLCCNNMKQEVI